MDTIFTSLSDCASLHPSVFDDEEGNGNGVGSGGLDLGMGMGEMDTEEGMFDDADGEQELSEAGRVRSDPANENNRFRPY